ncbi:hypothetical protein GGI21_002972, partial [Coemansia aciculifera]
MADNGNAAKASSGARQAAFSYADIAKGRSSDKPAEAGPESSSAVASVWLPARNSTASSVAMPAIQFGSLNQQTRPSSPLAAQPVELDTAAATSGGISSTLVKSGSKPKFGTVQSDAATDASELPEQPGHKKNSKKNKKNNRHQSQGSTPKPKGSRNGRQQVDVGAAEYFADCPFEFYGRPQARFPGKNAYLAPYMPQANVHYAMTQPAGYVMQPVAGWMPTMPHEFAYMPMGAPCYEQYWHAPLGAGSPPQHGVCAMPNYDLFSQTSSLSSSVTALSVNDQTTQSSLKASAQAFVPVRRPVRIVNPNTNEEIDLSKVQQRSVPTASESIEEKDTLPDVETASVEVIVEAVAEPLAEETVVETNENTDADQTALAPVESHRILSSAEIIELYAGESDVPTLVGEILRYPRVFLERFNGLCQPPSPANFELVDTDDQNCDMSRSTSGSSRPRDSALRSGFGSMGNFRHAQVQNSLETSDERFKRSTSEFWGRSDGDRESRGGRSTNARGGRDRNGGRRGSQHGRKRSDGYPQMDLANVKPLEKSENRYIPNSLRVDKDSGEDNNMQEQVFDRRIRALLNKLTLDNFDI